MYVKNFSSKCKKKSQPSKNDSQTFKKHPKSSKEALHSPQGLQEAGTVRTLLILHPFLDPPGEPKLMPNRPRNVPRRLRSQKSTSLETTSCKHWPRARFWRNLGWSLMIFFHKWVQENEENLEKNCFCERMASLIISSLRQWLISS